MGRMPCCSGSRMGCCHMFTGAAIVGTVELVIIMAMLSGAGLMLDRWRFWEQLKYDSDWSTTTVASTTTPTIPYVYTFSGTEEVQVGWILETTVTVKTSPTAFHVSLHCSDSNTKPLHFNPRWGSENFVARNTFQNNVWDENEEQDGGLPFSGGSTDTIRIECATDFWEISINGALFARYTHRIDYSCINTIYIDGSLETTPFKIKYTWNYGESLEGQWFEAWLEFVLAHHIAFCAVFALALVPYALAFYFFEPVWILPNLMMLLISICSLIFFLVAMMMRILSPATKYQTDEIQEAALLYVMIFAYIWLVVFVAFAWLVWRFYGWMIEENRLEVRPITTGFSERY